MLTSYGFNGGDWHSFAAAPEANGGFAIGVLVNANHGCRPEPGPAGGEWSRTGMVPL
ncbi:MAG: hypothetical protein IPO99_16070 [Nitrospira sp.]|nr:hypothetical protein [Nitrospira sp.]